MGAWIMAVAMLAGGAAIELRPGETLAAALGRARAGDRVIVHAGHYPHEEIRAAFPRFVTIEAARGAAPVFAGLTFRHSQHIRLRGLRVTGTLTLEHSAHFELTGLALDAGEGGGAALHLLTKRRDAGATHHVRVTRSIIRGGGRTVFVLTHFRPSEEWAHELAFEDNEMSCGSRTCFQLSGARDVLIARNRVVTAKAKGVLLAGAQRIRIVRNRLEGGAGPAIQIGTPGREWDAYAGVEHMISSDVLVEANVVRSWRGPAIQLDGCRHVSIVRNAAEGGSGLVTHRRAPTDLAGRTILVGNTGVRLRRNRLPAIETAEGDPPIIHER